MQDVKEALKEKMKFEEGDRTQIGPAPSAANSSPKTQTTSQWKSSWKGSARLELEATRSYKTAIEVVQGNASQTGAVREAMAEHSGRLISDR